MSTIDNDTSDTRSVTPVADSVTVRLLPHQMEAFRADEPYVALITGLGEGSPLRVSLAQVGDHWSGNAWVAWRDFEELPDILRPPLSGAPVIWLQQALGRMGFYDDAATGEFDAATIQGVRDLQASLQIEVDGTVGRVTKIRLYEKLGHYAVPRLRERDEVSG